MNSRTGTSVVEATAGFHSCFTSRALGPPCLKHECWTTSLMNKVNTTKMAELTWCSPKGKFSGAGKEISEALGRKPESTDLNERHPFDVEILRIPPGKAPYSYHSHSAQWEFYHV